MQLSVVIPALNERTNLEKLLPALLAQKDVECEFLVVDGKSSDGTAGYVASLQDCCPQIKLLESDRGRGKQMNAGVQVAQGEYLLFLHADTQVNTNALLTDGLCSLELAIEAAASHDVAGHFGLRFQSHESTAGMRWKFYEAKSHLNRPDCINGDQGIMIKRSYFEKLGGYDESLHFLEDLRLARKISSTGRWVNLPGHVFSSARRFEIEGFRVRQSLNAIIKCFDAIGLHGFFDQATTLYGEQTTTNKLHLAPFIRLAFKLIGRDVGIWYRIGRYINQNAWQLAFLMDCRATELPDQIQPIWLDRYDRWLRWLITSAPLNAITAVAAGFWGTSVLFRENYTTP